MKIIVDVLFPIYQEFPFSYYTESGNISLVGKRVIAPLSNQLKAGIIVAERIPEDDFSLTEFKELHAIVDDEPFLTLELIELIKFISSYYLSSMGDVLKFIIPNGTLPKITKTFRINDVESTFINLKSVIGKSEIKYKILNALKEKPDLNLSKLEELIGKTISKQINDLLKANIISQNFHVLEAPVKEKYERFLHPLPEAAKILGKIRPNAYKQLEVIEFLSNEKDLVSMKDLVQNNFLSSTAIKNLIEKDLIKSSLQEIERSITYNYKTVTENHDLNNEQKTAFNSIMQRINVFSTHLLFGITGSGKTLVYIKVLEEVIRAGKTAIILIPEISLTPQTASRFRSVFGNMITFLNSRMTDGERYDSWRLLRDGKYRIVIGPRSAILAPMENLGLIIVDEEHEWSYKQSDQNPRYNARDLAVYRAKLVACPVILGSATPSLESFHNAKTGKYILHELKKRPNDFSLPEVHLVNLKAEMEKKPSTENRLLSDELELAIEQRLLKKEQVILFINKRGYSSFVQCNDCGALQECPNCTITLVYHQHSKKMICHYCDYKEKSINQCKKCSSQSLKLRGFGTQRIEELLNERFSHAKVLRMDLDTTRKKNAHIDILRKFANHEADILFGTQMITKGLDFANVTLVGIISADMSLAIPDFRSAERSYQLFSQVAGRAGRGEKKGEVYIQTFLPDHYTIQFAKKHDYESFYETELLNRRPLNYPPFEKLINISFQSEKEDEVMNAARFLNIELHRVSKNNITALGPAPSLIYKVKNRYRWNILIKLQSNTAKTKGIVKYCQQETIRKYKNTIVTVDIDPYDLI